ncbi:MAG: type II/IV secretion system protein [Candidatus Omnitrophica bacterium]|nr:type II/IV secretion system protein [Candidatus Omnitrophota bacterium]
MSQLQERYNKLITPEVKKKEGLWGGSEKQEENVNLISKAVDIILEQAILERASDIHFEPVKGSLRVRFRIDGILNIVLNIEEPNGSVIVRRLKVMAAVQLDTAATQGSQDGRFKQKMGVSEYDFRLASFPTVLGEKIVVRVLNSNFSAYDLPKLGFDEKNLAMIKKMLQLKNGLLLVCGPTGSGKTTSLYSMLKQINTPAINVMTLEDPVEYQIDGMNQCDIKAKSKFHFADGLKAVLRQDPDIILVGEIRDGETAEIASRAAITGHLVFSSVHANSTIGTVVRLINMGLEAYLVSYALVGIVAQRLVRRICPQCRVSYKLSAEQAEIWRQYFTEGGSQGPKPIEYSGSSAVPLTDIMSYKGLGCPSCRMTGYAGRIGLYEVLMFNEELRQAILSGQSTVDLKKISVKNGTVLLATDAVKKVLAGLTTLEEVYPILIEPS